MICLLSARLLCCRPEGTATRFVLALGCGTPSNDLLRMWLLLGHLKQAPAARVAAVLAPETSTCCTQNKHLLHLNP